MTGDSPPMFEDDVLDPDARALIPLFVSTRRTDLAELRAALDVGDLELVRQVGHRIRGTAQSYGFIELGELATALERGSVARDVAEVEQLVARIAQWVAWLEGSAGASNS